MKKQSLLKKLHKPVHPKVAYAVLALAVVLIILGLFTALKPNTPVSHTHVGQTFRSPTRPFETPTPTPPPQTFTSTDLGISFEYANDPNYITTEIGNKVYIHAVKLPPTSGLYLEVFSKAPGDAIDTAIKKRFLQGIAESDCQVKVLSSLKQFTSNRWYLPSSYIVAEIIPGYQGSDLSTLQNNKCPSPYTYATEQQGLFFFLADLNHPNKLVFVYNGQSGIGSGRPNESWYQTIKLLETP